MRNTKTYHAISAPMLALLALLLFGATTITAAPGDLDPTFGIGGRLIDGGGFAHDVAVQSDGKIVVVGGHLADLVVARYNPNGSPDVTFGFGTGKVITDLGRQEYEWNIVIQPDGKIVAGGVSVRNGAASFLIVRYNSDGSFDTGFGGGTGKVLTALPCGDTDENYGADFTIQPDGKFVGAVKFEYCPGQLIRYISDGSLDVSFGNHGFVTLANGTSSLNSVFIQPNGKVIWGFEYSGVYRYEPNGSRDLSFGSGGHVLCPFLVLTSVIIQPDGKIVAFGGWNGNSYALVRYNINGSPDTSFGLYGLVTAPIGVYLGSAAIQPDGKIVAAGSSKGINGTSDFTLVRYNGDGSLDGSFGGGDGITTVDFNNSSDGASDVALDSQGRAVVVGASGGMFAIARFLGDPTPTLTCPNPIDCADFFVRQHYRDFLNREPDAAGLAYWTDQINSCSGDPQCIETKRINISAAYFLSIEFQQTGYLVYRLYKAAYGNLPGAPVPIRLNEFLPDTRAIGQGVVVNQSGWEQLLESNKQAFANEFVQRSRFASTYPTSMSAEQFVDALFANAGVTPSASDRNAAINEFAFGATTNDPAARARVLRRVAENGTLAQQEFNRAFVLMQYFGYLRRNPNDAPESGLNFDGYNFWLNKLDSFNGDFVQAEMVKAFITSVEYRKRFGV